MTCSGAILCAIGFVSAITVGLLDKVGVQQLGQADTLQQDSKKVVCMVYGFTCLVSHRSLEQF
jgi:Na+/H+ antiporter NhaA